MDLSALQSGALFLRATIGNIDISSWIERVSVTEDEWRADTATISIPDPGFVYSDVLQEGASAIVDIGYALQHSIMMKGLVTQVQVHYPRKGTPRLMLKVMDDSIRMALNSSKALWNWEIGVMRVSDVVRRIALVNGFVNMQVEIANDRVIDQNFYLAQEGMSDLGFLQKLAQEYHCRCFVEFDLGISCFYFIPEAKLVSKNQLLQLDLEYLLGTNNLLQFTATEDTSFYARQKVMTTMDPKTGEVVSNQPAFSLPMPASLPGTQALAGWLPHHPEDALKIVPLVAANTTANMAYMAKVKTPQEIPGHPGDRETVLDKENIPMASQKKGMRGSGSAKGNIWLRAKSCVNIQGLSSRFNGRWYVNSVTHNITVDSFISDFDCSR